jgi:putative transcriptional regulator
MKNAVKVMRAGKNWSQAELAERLSVSRQTVNSIETERSEPSLTLAMRLARLFGVRVEDLFSLDELDASSWDALVRTAGGM